MVRARKKQKIMTPRCNDCRRFVKKGQSCRICHPDGIVSAVAPPATAVNNGEIPTKDNDPVRTPEKPAGGTDKTKVADEAVAREVTPDTAASKKEAVADSTERKEKLGDSLGAAKKDPKAEDGESGMKKGEVEKVADEKDSAKKGGKKEEGGGPKVGGKQEEDTSGDKTNEAKKEGTEEATDGKDEKTEEKKKE